LFKIQGSYLEIKKHGGSDKTRFKHIRGPTGGNKSQEKNTGKATEEAHVGKPFNDDISGCDGILLINYIDYHAGETKTQFQREFLLLRVKIPICVIAQVAKYWKKKHDCRNFMIILHTSLGLVRTI
jgi:hypothetical protein